MKTKNFVLILITVLSFTSMSLADCSTDSNCVDNNPGPCTDRNYERGCREYPNTMYPPSEIWCRCPDSLDPPASPSPIGVCHDGNPPIYIVDQWMCAPGGGH